MRQARLSESKVLAAINDSDYGALDASSIAKLLHVEPKAVMPMLHRMESRQKLRSTEVGGRKIYRVPSTDATGPAWMMLEPPSPPPSFAVRLVTPLGR